MEDLSEAWVQEPAIWLPTHALTLLGGGVVVNEAVGGGGVEVTATPLLTGIWL